jgi:hypothetical protein
MDDLDHPLTVHLMSMHHQMLAVRYQNLSQLVLSLQLPEAVSKSVVELLMKV